LIFGLVKILKIHKKNQNNLKNKLFFNFLKCFLFFSTKEKDSSQVILLLKANTFIKFQYLLISLLINFGFERCGFCIVFLKGLYKGQITRMVSFSFNGLEIVKM